MKHALDAKIIESLTGTAVNATSQVLTLRYHCPESSIDVFKTRFSFFVAILLQFTYVFTLVVNIGNLIVEKQTKMKVNYKIFIINRKENNYISFD